MDILLPIILILSIFLLFMFYNNPCEHSYKSKSGKRYKCRDIKTAEVLDVLRIISNDLAKRIDEDDSEILLSNLQNTSFKEVINSDPNILAWNYDKGREIAVRIYDVNDNPLPAETIIESLFHELAHSITINVWGHGAEWEENNRELQSLKDKYVDILLLKTFLED
tara:strand:- start:417 stop:914 length:498 start_codon:yes stop_codon:yes gene_type:complete